MSNIIEKFANFIPRFPSAILSRSYFDLPDEINRVLVTQRLLRVATTVPLDISVIDVSALFKTVDIPTLFEDLGLRVFNELWDVINSTSYIILNVTSLRRFDDIANHMQRIEFIVLSGFYNTENSVPPALIKYQYYQNSPSTAGYQNPMATKFLVEYNDVSSKLLQVEFYFTNNSNKNLQLITFNYVPDLNQYTVTNLYNLTDTLVTDAEIETVLNDNNATWKVSDVDLGNLDLNIQQYIRKNLDPVSGQSSILDVPAAFVLKQISQTSVILPEVLPPEPPPTTIDID